MANPNQNSPSLEEMNKQIALLQLQKLQRDLAKDEEKDEIEKKKVVLRKKAVEQEVEAARESQVIRAEQQARCPHMSGRTSFVRGQHLGNAKDKDGSLRPGFLAFCQICLKEYNSWDAIPEHLRSDINYFGGPRTY